MQIARDGRATPRTRRAYLADATRQLALEKEKLFVESARLDERLDACGMASVDKDSSIQCRAFLARVGRDTLEQLQTRHEIETAIGAAELELELLEPFADAD